MLVVARDRFQIGAMNPLVMLAKARRVYVRMPRSLPARPLLTEPLEGMFSPSMLPPGTRFPLPEIAFVCRKEYYQIDRRGIMIGPPILQKTVNWMHRAVRDGDQFRVISSEPVPVFNGIEDLRFYDHGGMVYVTGTRPDFSGRRISTPFVARARSIDAAIGPGDLHNFEIGTQISPVEKNWVYFADLGRLYLERLPGLRDYYEVDEAEARLRRRELSQQPFFWSGTKSVPWRGGNLFLDHKRIYPMSGLRTVMRFAYRFRFHSSGMGPARISREFSLAGGTPTTVYASDMAIDDRQVMIGVGIGDCASQIFGCQLAHVAQLLGM